MLDRRARRLGGERRAGASLAVVARRQQLTYVRRNWRLLVGFAAVFFVFSPVLLVVPELLRPYVAGAYVASAFWLTVLAVWQFSGVGHLQLGEYAERWTAQELRKLRRDGWKPLHQVVFRHGDIDHVLVGPGGVVVVETKGGRTDWSDHAHERRLQAAARQVQRNAADTRRVLRHLIKDAPVHPVVVLWPSPDHLQVRAGDGATFVPGLRLAGWVEALPTGQLDHKTIEASWERIAKHVEDRDADDLAKHGPPPRSVERWFADTLQYLMGACAGLLLAAQFLTRSVPIALVGTVLSIAAAGLTGRRLIVAQRLLYTTAATASVLSVVALTVDRLL